MAKKLQAIEASKGNDPTSVVSNADEFIKIAQLLRVNWQAQKCPDLLVIDDFDLGFRDLPLKVKVIKDVNTGRTELSFDVDDIEVAKANFKLITSEPSVSRGIEEGAKPGSVENSKQQRTDNLGAALTLLLNCFHYAHLRATKRNNIPIMEPVILASIANKPHEVYSHNQGNDRETFWTVIQKHEWLRERTVVLLNADDLRLHELPISTGLSWERTAQDTIAEMRRSPEFRQFFSMGQVIVRFGMTGALHIVRRSSTEWSYSLFFDPDLDDAIWTNHEKDGEVLGANAVFLASVAEQLAVRCEKAGGHPFLSDLSEAVQNGIFKAIGRCRNLTTTSYGQGRWKGFVDRTYEGKSLPINVFQIGEKDSDVLEVPVTSVPQVVLREWSILNQSVQTRVGDIAREIVRFGVGEVLNQPPLGRGQPFASACLGKTLKYVAEEVTRHFKNKKLDPKYSDIDYDVLIRTGIDKLYGDDDLFGKRSHYFRRAVVENPTEHVWKDFIVAVRKSIENNAKQIEGLAGRIAEYTAEQLAGQLANDEAISVEQIRKALKFHGHDDGFDEIAVAPIVRFGKEEKNKPDQQLCIVDRREIEGYRAIEKLMRAHVDAVKEGKNSRPLSIAIFGPPGSGKSMAVKSINETLADNKTKVLPAYNLSQFSSIADLDKAFTEIHQEGSGMIPIAFFDEFDCRFVEGDAPLGWLKFFLAPMEDGVFRGNSVKDAILVFAGGTKTTFNDFSLAGRSRDDKQWIEFSDSKGPDFVSRLRGHLNIVGINPADPDDQLYLIRRALLIRSLLSRMQNLAKGDKAQIDENMLRSILHVPAYRHGGRAVRMLLELCSTGKNSRISASAVPPIEQLNMLVDGKAFLDLLNGVA